MDQWGAHVSPTYLNIFGHTLEFGKLLSRTCLDGKSSYYHPKVIDVVSQGASSSPPPPLYLMQCFIIFNPKPLENIYFNLISISRGEETSLDTLIYCNKTFGIVKIKCYRLLAHLLNTGGY